MGKQFGNGTQAAVVNQNGKRSSLFERLNQMAYLWRCIVIAPNSLVADAPDGRRCQMQTKIGRIRGAGSCIAASSAMSTSDRRRSDGAQMPKTEPFERTGGSGLCRCRRIANDFIFCERQRRNNVILRKCFVGQSTELSRSFTAGFSFLRQLFHGTGTGLFSQDRLPSASQITLLIAGLCSFSTPEAEPTSPTTTTGWDPTSRESSNESNRIRAIWHGMRGSALRCDQLHEANRTPPICPFLSV